MCDKSKVTNNKEKNQEEPSWLDIQSSSAIFQSSQCCLLHLQKAWTWKSTPPRPPSLVVRFQMWCLESQSQYKQACLPLSVSWNQTLNSFPEWVIGGTVEWSETGHLQWSSRDPPASTSPWVKQFIGKLLVRRAGNNRAQGIQRSNMLLLFN